MKRPKPNQEAIAAALQAMQRLTMKMDSEAAVEETTTQSAVTSTVACATCGHHNREGNKFCGMCGLPVDGSSAGGDEKVAVSGPKVASSKMELPDFARELVQSSPSAPEGIPNLFQNITIVRSAVINSRLISSWGLPNDGTTLSHPTASRWNPMLCARSAFTLLSIRGNRDRSATRSPGQARKTRSVS